MSEPEPERAPRHLGLEVGRSLAMLGVVLLHAFAPGTLYTWARPFALFAVPFFFVLSGYLIGLRAKSPAHAGQLAIKQASRALALFVVWALVYTFIPLEWLRALREGQLLRAMGHNAERALSELVASPLALLDGPPGGFHLWFLPALACAALLVAAALRSGRTRLATWLFAGLFVFGLLAGRYAGTPIGLSLDLQTRNGPFQSTWLVWCGYLYATSLRVPRGAWGPLLFVAGALLVLAEEATLRALGSDVPDTYSLAVLPLGVGALWMAARAPRLPTQLEPLARSLGYATLGIYLLHVLLRDLHASVLAALGFYDSSGQAPQWAFASLFVVTALCVQAALRVPPLRRVLT